jgi:ATPase subunit of ABC transporter with duplicated ATPase domains
MRGYVAASDVSKSFGALAVLRSVSLTVPPGARVGVLGPNGIGKTTLLRVLAGLEEPDTGTVVRQGEVGFVPQEPDALPGETIDAYLARRTGAAAGRVRATCSKLHLEGDSPLDNVSGGQAARARLAAILLGRFDLYCLDEPTNDLDFDGIALLERFVAGLRVSLVVVSHDRAFLERAVERVVELEPETRRLREYAGGFGEYERMRAVARRGEEAAWQRYEDERGRFGGLLAERRSQARAGGRQASRRGTNALRQKVRQAERRLERLERERPETPWDPWRLQLELAEGGRGSDLVVALEGAVLERGGFRLGPLDLEVRRGERLAVVGPNGSGKSTLLAALLGELPLVAGRRRLGPSARLGTLDQRRALLDTDAPLLEPFRRASGLGEQETRTLLGRFALRGDAVLRPARSLSPGERTRALVALLAAAGANALVLDEPTNHLDLEAIEELEAALQAFAGALVLVTHDRRLLEAVGPTGTLELNATYFPAR